MSDLNDNHNVPDPNVAAPLTNNVAANISIDPSSVSSITGTNSGSDSAIGSGPGSAVVSESSSDSNIAIATKGGREISNKILHVSNLHKSIEEDKLNDVFSTYGPIKLIKVLNDKNKVGWNYAFIEFVNPADATSASNALNDTPINDVNIRIKWAYNSSNANSVQSTEPVYNVFVGDLSPEVDDTALRNAFSSFNSLREAHVMWDMQTARSRGYGFVTFLDQKDAQMALGSMNGRVLHGRAIRCNWAAHRQQQQQQASGPSNFKRNRKPGQRMPAAANQFGQLPPQHQHQHQNQAVLPVPFPTSQQPMGINNPVNADVHPQIQSIHHPRQLHTMHPSQFPQGPPQGLNPPSSGANVSAPGNTASSTSSPSHNGQPLYPMAHNEVFPRFDQLELGPGHNGANQQPTLQPQSLPAQGPNPLMAHNSDKNLGMMPQSYDIVLRQSPNWQTTVYLGNIAHFTNQNDLIQLVQNFGYIVDLKFHPDKGCAFVKYDNHERAALAIVQLAGFNLNGRPLKCGWGKERPPQYRNVQPYQRG